MLFSAFIVVDTQKILKKVSTDEYILCAIDLYLDIINLFLYILRMLNERNWSKELNSSPPGSPTNNQQNQRLDTSNRVIRWLKGFFVYRSLSLDKDDTHLPIW